MLDLDIYSNIKCPKCGFEKREIMHENSCQFFYSCNSCDFLLKPKKDDCCVFCSYGDVKCPPIQKNDKCC